jgi:four helix bundle protein
MAGQSYRDLEVWQRGVDLAEMAYRITWIFPREEVYGLSSQLQRSASSVPANIAEGQGRLHRGDFIRSLSIARGSLYETETHLYIAARLGYLDKQKFDEAWDLCQQVGRLLNGLIRHLENQRDS